MFEVVFDGLFDVFGVLMMFGYDLGVLVGVLLVVWMCLVLLDEVVGQDYLLVFGLLLCWLVEGLGVVLVIFYGFLGSGKIMLVVLILQVIGCWFEVLLVLLVGVKEVWVVIENL